MTHPLSHRLRSTVPLLAVSLLRISLGEPHSTSRTSSTAIVQTRTPPLHSYHLITSIPYRGEVGSLSVDTAHRRLYGVGQDIIDIDSNRVLPHPSSLTFDTYSVVFAPELNHGLTNSGTLFDLTTLQALATVHAKGSSEVASTYDPTTQHAFVWSYDNAEYKSVYVVDMKTGAMIDSTLDLGGRPQAGVADGRGLIFVGRENMDSLLVIDAKTLIIVHRWGLGACKHPVPKAMDRVTHRLFVGCMNGLYVVDSNNGMVMTRVGEHYSGKICFDPKRKNLLFPDRSGRNVLVVVHEDTPDTYSTIQTVQLPHTSEFATLDERTGTVYDGDEDTPGAGHWIHVVAP